jgi:glycosyltransferase involved in cell wall biosynthesis
LNILEIEYSKGWGGQEKRTIRLINNLDKNKYKVFFVAQPDSNIVKHQDEIDAKIIPLKMGQIYNIWTILKLAFLVRKYHIDIISTHSGKDAWLGAIVGKITDVPVIRTRHLLTKINSPKSYNLSTITIAVSKQVENYLKSRGVKTVKTIYTGIDTELYKPNELHKLRKKFNIDKDTIIIGIVAVLRAAKRHKDLIEAVSKIDKNVKLFIVGDGPQRENLEKLIKEKNLSDKVIMTGQRDDVPEILSDFDIFVLPSREEALGTSILEASSCGVPVIGSRVGGIPECVKEDKNGLLFEAMNVDDLKEKLLTLINDKEKLNFYKKNARKFIKENFSVEKMVNETEKLYDELKAKS